MDNKPLAEITESDLQELIANEVAEGRAIDYKRETNCTQDAEKKEFLADISSFANTLGGHVIIGMEEQNALPTNLVGIPKATTDQLILQIEGIIRDGLDPRLVGVQSQVVDLSNGNAALVVRIPKSFAAPHMVFFKRTSRFYARTSRGKYQLDAGEIRQAFLLSDTLTKNIEDFRLNRLAALKANETLYPMPEGGKIVLHVIPVGAFTAPDAVDLSKIDATDDLWKNLLPMASSGWDRRYNLEGWLMHAVTRGQVESKSYTQVFRNGCVEMVEGRKITGSPYEAFWEPNIIEALDKLLVFFSTAGLQPPLIVMLSFLGVGQCEARDMNPLRRVESAHPVEREDIVCDPLWIQEIGKSATDILRPAFDRAWNACGYPKFPY